MARGERVYHLHLSGGSAPLTFDAAAASWSTVALHLRRRHGLHGYARFLQLDPGRVGTHAHALVAVGRPMGRNARSVLEGVALDAGFGFSRVHAVRSLRGAETAAHYGTLQLVGDGRALAGSGAKLATWSRSWSPRGWVG